jgi:hypothetical protein
MVLFHWPTLARPVRRTPETLEANMVHSEHAKLHHSMRHGCVYSIELTDKWRRVHLHGKATRWLDLTHRERIKHMSATAL